VTAIRTKTGELKFVSGTEESEGLTLSMPAALGALISNDGISKFSLV
jgi:hypothetical protein